MRYSYLGPYWTHAANDELGWAGCRVSSRHKRLAAKWRQPQAAHPTCSYFKPHTDGFLHVSSQERSFLTVLIYLNNVGNTDYNGGGTRFLPTRSTAPPAVVRPVMGSMLCFDHHLYHEGEALQSGWKYVLRADIMFCAHSTKVLHTSSA